MCGTCPRIDSHVGYGGFYQVKSIERGQRNIVSYHPMHRFLSIAPYQDIDHRPLFSTKHIVDGVHIDTLAVQFLRSGLKQTVAGSDTCTIGRASRYDLRNHDSIQQCIERNADTTESAAKRGSFLGVVGLAKEYGVRVELLQQIGNHIVLQLPHIYRIDIVSVDQIQHFIQIARILVSEIEM